MLKLECTDIRFSDLFNFDEKHIIKNFTCLMLVLANFLRYLFKILTCHLQIAVSPGSRALSLFCSQDPSLGVFPQFFVSTEFEKPTNKFLSFTRSHGVFGIGVAVFIKTPFSSTSIENISFRRYQSLDSAHLQAYSLFGHNSLKYENISPYMFIPQVIHITILSN